MGAPAPSTAPEETGAELENADTTSIAGDEAAPAAEEAAPAAEEAGSASEEASAE